MEDFEKAKDVYQLQQLAEEGIEGFRLDEKQGGGHPFSFGHSNQGGWMLWPGGSVDLTKGSILLGPCSDFGLLEGWPQVLRHCDCFAASAKKNVEFSVHSASMLCSDR